MTERLFPLGAPSADAMRILTSIGAIAQGPTPLARAWALGLAALLGALEPHRNKMGSRYWALSVREVSENRDAALAALDCLSLPDRKLIQASYLAQWRKESDSLVPELMRAGYDALSAGFTPKEALLDPIPKGRGVSWLPMALRDAARIERERGLLARATLGKGDAGLSPRPPRL